MQYTYPSYNRSQHLSRFPFVTTSKCLFIETKLENPKQYYPLMTNTTTTITTDELPIIITITLSNR